MDRRYNSTYGTYKSKETLNYITTQQKVSTRDIILSNSGKS